MPKPQRLPAYLEKIESEITAWKKKFTDASICRSSLIDHFAMTTTDEPVNADQAAKILAVPWSIPSWLKPTHNQRVAGSSPAGPT